LTIDKPVQTTKYIEETSCINSAFMMFGYLGALANDTKSIIMLDMLGVILGEGSSSRLYQNLIEKQKEPIFNLIDSEHYVFRDGSNFFIQANFIPEKKEQAIELVKAELEKVKTDITEEEFKKAKKKIKSRFAAEAETVSEIGESIGYYMTVCNDLKPVETYLKLLDEITVAELEDTAKKYLDINNAVISILMPEK